MGASIERRICRVVLFCNSQQSARFVEHTLSEEGFATANYHGAIPAGERQAAARDHCYWNLPPGRSAGDMSLRKATHSCAPATHSCASPTACV